MKEHLLTLEQHRERPMDAAYASIMQLEPQTPLKLIPRGDENRVIRYGDGATSDQAATAAAFKVKFWLIALAMACLALSYWVVFRHF